MKAIFEVDFNKEDMISDEDLKEYYDNDLFKFMKELINEEGFGIFDNDFKLKEIKEDNGN